jgi:hypothetical protein
VEVKCRGYRVPATSRMTKSWTIVAPAVAGERARHLRPVGLPGRLAVAGIDPKHSRQHLEIEQVLLLAAVGIVTGARGRGPPPGAGRWVPCRFPLPAVW